MKRPIGSSALGFLFALFFTPAFAAEVLIPDTALKRVIWENLQKAGPVGTLTEDDMLILKDLNAGSRGVMSLEGLGAAHNLTTLYVGQNQLTNLKLPAGLSSLTTLFVSENQLTNLTLPAGLRSLTTLDLARNRLTSLTLPVGLTSLITLDLGYNQLTSVTLPAGLTNLTTLFLGLNQLTSLTLPAGLTSLATLHASHNHLTSLTLPPDLPSLTQLYLHYNPLKDFSFLSGLPSLTHLSVGGTESTSLTLPAGLTSLRYLDLGPFVGSLTLPEPLALGALAPLVARLTRDEVHVSIYLPGLKLTAIPRTGNGAGELQLDGPPGSYTMQVTAGFADSLDWSDLTKVTIPQTGSVRTADPSANSRIHSFYRAVRSN